MEMKSYATVHEYIANFPSPTQEILRTLQSLILRIAPNAQEVISYGIPTYKVGKKRIHFGGYEKHISLHPGSTGVAVFAHELKDYETSKGTIRFNLDQPIPYDLIEKITRYCLTE